MVDGVISSCSGYFFSRTTLGNSANTLNFNPVNLICYLQELIYQEFFKQGDLEKSLGRDPLLMMDREKACIPELQVGFLESIALPLYSYVSIINIITKIY